MSIQLVNNGNRVFDTHLRYINRSDALWILGQVSEPNYNVKTLNSEVQFKISNKESYVSPNWVYTSQHWSNWYVTNIFEPVEKY